MDLKTALNRCHRYKSFVYGKSVLDDDGVHVEIRARKGSKGICSGCGKKGPTYDTARSPRPFEFVPLWGFLVFLRAYLLKESLDAFWQYTRVDWASWFLDKWCTRALRSRLEPMKKIARTLRSHHDLILNWFLAKKEISSGSVEGMNTNAKLAIRKARGFRTYEVLETALYHELGHLPESTNFTHGFC